jgi:hypothetical protein
MTIGLNPTLYLFEHIRPVRDTLFFSVFDCDSCHGVTHSGYHTTLPRFKLYS